MIPVCDFLCGHSHVVYVTQEIFNYAESNSHQGFFFFLFHCCHPVYFPSGAVSCQRVHVREGVVPAYCGAIVKVWHSPGAIFSLSSCKSQCRNRRTIKGMPPHLATCQSPLPFFFYPPRCLHTRWVACMRWRGKKKLRQPWVRSERERNREGKGKKEKATPLSTPSIKRRNLKPQETRQSCKV